MPDTMMYGRLYSTDEALVIYSGTGKNASSLDEAIMHVNTILSSRHFAKVPTKPQLQKEEVNLESLTREGFLKEGETRAYLIGLGGMPVDRQNTYDIVTSELNSYLRKKTRGITVLGSLPILIRDKKKEQAEGRLDNEKDFLMKRFKGRPEKRKEELAYYMGALLSMNRENEGLYVLERNGNHFR